jgi:hypothetical protein
MNPLLTKEANDTVERIREYVIKFGGISDYISVKECDLIAALSIFDSLKQQEPDSKPKQYTEDEALLALKDDSDRTMVMYVPDFREGFHCGLRLVGALKETENGNK